MPDITCCINNECQLRQRCYRFMAEWDKNQSISHFRCTDTGYKHFSFLAIKEGQTLDKEKLLQFNSNNKKD